MLLSNIPEGLHIWRGVGASSLPSVTSFPKPFSLRGCWVLTLQSSHLWAKTQLLLSSMLIAHP